VDENYLFPHLTLTFSRTMHTWTVLAVLVASFLMLTYVNGRTCLC